MSQWRMTNAAYTWHPSVELDVLVKDCPVTVLVTLLITLLNQLVILTHFPTNTYTALFLYIFVYG